MPVTRQRVREELWGDYSPFDGFPIGTAKLDGQGWQSQHPYLLESVKSHRPDVIVEVGVWKGGSTIEMAKGLQTEGIDGVVIAVDTWLGASDHWLSPEWKDHLGFEFGFPTIYRIFIANVISNNLQDFVVPLPLDSSNAAEVVLKKRIKPSLIHVDAGHDYNSAWNDITLWWELLAPGGWMIVDDFSIDGNCWPGVFQAVNEFKERYQIEEFESIDLKCRFKKPRV